MAMSGSFTSEANASFFSSLKKKATNFAACTATACGNFNDYPDKFESAKEKCLGTAKEANRQPNCSKAYWSAYCPGRNLTDDKKFCDHALKSMMKKAVPHNFTGCTTESLDSNDKKLKKAVMDNCFDPKAIKAAFATTSEDSESENETNEDASADNPEKSELIQFYVDFYKTNCEDKPSKAHIAQCKKLHDDVPAYLETQQEKTGEGEEAESATSEASADEEIADEESDE